MKSLKNKYRTNQVNNIKKKMEIFGACPWNAANKNTIWSKETVW